jgi:hypothetical protein
MARPITGVNPHPPTSQLHGPARPTRAPRPRSTSSLDTLMATRVLRGFLWFASAAVVGLYLFLAIRRLMSPTPFEPGETALLDHAIRLAHWKPLYDQPAAGSAPVSILPAFPLAVTVMVQSMGPALWEPRLVTLLATLALAALVLIAVRTETGSWSLGAVGAALALAGCAVIAGPPGVARPEPLTLVLALASFLTLRDIDGVMGAVMAAFLMAVACYTQQFALCFAAGAVVYLAIEQRRRAVQFLLAFAAIAGGGYVALSQVLGPWFNYYASDLSIAAMQFDPRSLVHVAGDLMLGRMSILIVTALIALALPAPIWRGTTGVWFWSGVASLLAGLIASQVSGVAGVALVPCIVSFALLGPIAADKVIEHVSAWPGSTRRAGEGVLFAALLLQLALFLSGASRTLL